MRRQVSGLIAVGIAASLALTGCSTSHSSTSTSAPGATKSAAKNVAHSAVNVLSAANIKTVIASYPGDVTKLPPTFGTPKAGALKIGWASPLAANELVGRLGSALAKQVPAMGGTLTTYDAAGDPGKQVSAIQQFINDKVDAIIVWPLDATALVPAIQHAKAAGIPVIAMEATPDATGAIGKIAGQVIYGRDLDAYLAATLMSQLFPAGQVAVAKFAVPVPSINYFAERATYWAKKGGLTVVGSFDNPSDDVAGGEGLAGPLLAKYPNLKGILAYNDATGIGALAAARAGGRTLTAFGNNGDDSGVQAVKSGKLSLTIQPPVVDWADQLVAGAYLAKAGATIPKTVFTGIGTVITPDSVSKAHTTSSLISTAYGS